MQNLREKDLVGKKLLMGNEHIYRISKTAACLLLIAVASRRVAECATCGDSLQILLHVHGQDTLAATFAAFVCGR